MESIYGPKELKTSLKREVGTMSLEVEEGQIWETMAVRMKLG